MSYSDLTTVISSLAAVCALLALAYVINRNGTRPTRSRLEQLEAEILSIQRSPRDDARIGELEELVKELQREIEDLKSAYKILMGMNGDLARKNERWERDYSVSEQENRLLRQRLATLGVDK